jgi:transposase-like protein
VNHRRDPPERALSELIEADRLLGDGAVIAAARQHLDVSEQSYHYWREQYGSMEAGGGLSASRSSSTRTAGSSESWQTRPRT